jgi:hypothetical protein
MNIAEYLKTKCKAVQSAKTAKSHESGRRNTNSTIKTATKLQKNQTVNSIESSDTKKGRQTGHKSKIRRVLKEKMGQQSNVWPVY